MPPPPGVGAPTYGGPGVGAPHFGVGVPTGPKRSGKAIAAMVLGISGILMCFLGVVSVLAIIFALLSLKQIKTSGGAISGRGMAIAGLVTGIVGVLAGAGFWIAYATGAFPNEKSVFDLKAGDCVESLDPNASEVARLEVFDCDEPHGAEVFATGDLGGGDEPYPGVQEVQRMIEARCRPEFADYVGIDFEDSVLEVTTIYPQRDDWEATQNYVCLAFERVGDLTESIKDSRR
jgi:hypothetical protein